MNIFSEKKMIKINYKGYQLLGFNTKTQNEVCYTTIKLINERRTLKTEFSTFKDAKNFINKLIRNKRRYK